MKLKHSKEAFTLVEILVAMAVVVSIVSMVYGSYVATAQSAASYETRMRKTQLNQRVLENLARQVRGCCLPLSATATGRSIDSPATATTSHELLGASRKAATKTQRLNAYFSGNSAASNGLILQIITTNAFASNQDAMDSLFEVAYKFDRINGRLLSSRQGFTVNSQSKRKPKEKTWQLIAENVERVDLAFFDGKQWLGQWTFASKRTLPYAVRIEITGSDKNKRTYHNATTARLYCSNPLSNETRLDGLLPIEK